MKNTVKYSIGYFMKGVVATTTGFATVGYAGCK